MLPYHFDLNFAAVIVTQKIGNWVQFGGIWRRHLKSGWVVAKTGPKVFVFSREHQELKKLEKLVLNIVFK